ncbi:2,3-bisphosphoglycerate-independent phosphoglycerate mutase [Candidatus Peregrinibacteria bacterium]|jgi:2,3-bisphosphoglycerate-independent phosphoglycerate mutase|nr:2,3-bisphosphoglycerate-independent phosphoglycerate mutase [Candidatus Peregrinibacteria bacterium]MBT4056263.1 2,3-bisphosphoglycerate-independent phosphoglycerate mutase [Candidatus Peregrinibacteria bacterium]
MKNKALLIILDGYGEGKDYKYNAVTRANTPFLDSIRKTYPSCLLKTDSEAVGLPPKTMGGSEVGHFTIGAGRVVWQSLEEINRSIRKKKFFKLPPLKEAAKKCKQKDSSFHIMGMISDEGVHSHLDHLHTLLKFAKKNNLKKIYIHAITDGRDVPEQSAKKFIKRIQKWIRDLDLEDRAKIATIVGRYYAMDRDTNWKRTQKAYNLFTKGKGTRETSPLKAIENEYKRGTKTDYYIEPIILDKKGVIKPEDSIVFFNYRTDRAAQLTENFLKAKKKPYFVCFGPYSKKAPVLFPAPTVKKNLSEILAKKGRKQLRIAETEKYAHVTFFFNSQVKKAYKNEKRIMIPSPKVASYAEKPEMSAPKVKDTLIKELGKNYDFIACNFANPDLVGHSGSFLAVKKGLGVLDKCLREIVPKALKEGYTILLTADHGNAEAMKYPDGSARPAHTLNPVRFFLISEKFKKLKTSLKNKGLKNIAPTILKILKIRKPRIMKGKSLI